MAPSIKNLCLYSTRGLIFVNKNKMNEPKLFFAMGNNMKTISTRFYIVVCQSMIFHMKSDSDRMKGKERKKEWFVSWLFSHFFYNILYFIAVHCCLMRYFHPAGLYGHLLSEWTPWRNVLISQNDLAISQNDLRPLQCRFVRIKMPFLYIFFSTSLRELIITQRKLFLFDYHYVSPYFGIYL